MTTKGAGRIGSTEVDAARAPHCARVTMGGQAKEVKEMRYNLVLVKGNVILTLSIDTGNGSHQNGESNSETVHRRVSSEL